MNLHSCFDLCLFWKLSLWIISKNNPFSRFSILWFLHLSALHPQRWVIISLQTQTRVITPWHGAFIPFVSVAVLFNVVSFTFRQCEQSYVWVSSLAHEQSTFHGTGDGCISISLLVSHPLAIVFLINAVTS